MIRLEVGVALAPITQKPIADHDRQRADLDQGEDDVELHALAHAAQVDQRRAAP